MFSTNLFSSVENICVLFKILSFLENIYSAEQWFLSCYNMQDIRMNVKGSTSPLGNENEKQKKYLFF